MQPFGCIQTADKHIMLAASLIGFENKLRDSDRECDHITDFICI
ncbi:Uncharacterised protein [Providencia rettgeri]|uniref:Uncharacterized protein n=1 Tax=Providencia rettgeri TaxID=587 RepID=A0A379FW69_PRORE|nr:Uncharacterised protein [Providencia rettgeri]